MESGGAAGGGGTAAGVGDGQQAQGEQQGEQQQQAAPDFAALAAQMEGSVSQQLEQMREWMAESQQSLQQQLAPEQPVEPQQTDLSFVDPNSPNYDPERAAAQLLDVLTQQQKDAVNEQIAPLQQQLSEMQSAREADFLAQEFPDLQNPETADAVFRATHEWVQAAGLPIEAASNMQVVRAVYMMGRAAELNATEQQAGQQQAAALEGAGGASPGGTGGGLTAASIISGGGGTSPLPFK